jgi:hypothetical protein
MQLHALVNAIDALLVALALLAGYYFLVHRPKAAAVVLVAAAAPAAAEPAEADAILAIEKATMAPSLSSSLSTPVAVPASVVAHKPADEQVAAQVDAALAPTLSSPEVEASTPAASLKVSVRLQDLIAATSEGVAEEALLDAREPAVEAVDVPRGLKQQQQDAQQQPAPAPAPVSVAAGPAQPASGRAAAAELFRKKKTHSAAAAASARRPSAARSTSAAVEPAVEAAPCLKLAQEIPLVSLGKPVLGRVDHFALDRKRLRLYVACLGSDCVVIVDVFAGLCTGTLDGSIRPPRSPEGAITEENYTLHRPQGVLFTERQRLYVANAGDGVVHIFDCASTLSTDAHGLPHHTPGHTHLGCVQFGEEADNLRYADGRVHVGYGDGAVGVIEDAAATYLGSAGIIDSTSKRLAPMVGTAPSPNPNPRNRYITTARVDPARDWPCAEHPEGFQIESAAAPQGRRRIFVNVADERLVQVT